MTEHKQAMYGALILIGIILFIIISIAVALSTIDPLLPNGLTAYCANTYDGDICRITW